MIGPTKLSDIKQELRRVLRKSKPSLERWIDEQLSEPLPEDDRSRKMVEDLLWVRQVLRGTSPEKKPRSKPSASRR